jgi:hypothetical protein
MKDWVGDFATVTVGKGDSGGHMLLATHLGDALDGISRHGERRPTVTDDACARGKTHEVVPALAVPGGSKTDGAKGTMSKIVAVFFVSLNVGSKWEPDVFVIC